MKLCPRCRTRIDDRKLNQPSWEMRCPKCLNEINNEIAVDMIKFPDCVIKLSYVGLNSEEDANALLRMMKEAI